MHIAVMSYVVIGYLGIFQKHFVGLTLAKEPDAHQILSKSPSSIHSRGQIDGKAHGLRKTGDCFPVTIVAKPDST